MRGDPVTPVVLQKVQPLIAVSLAAAILGERPRRASASSSLGGLAGTWLMAFPSPFDVSLHGRGACALRARRRPASGRSARSSGASSTLRLTFQHVTAVRFAFGLPAAFVAVLVLGAPATASWHDEFFIALLALVTGLVAVLLYYYGLRRTTASVASVAELTFPVVAIAVGYLAFDATLTSSQLAGVVLTSLVVLLLPGPGPGARRQPRARPSSPTAPRRSARATRPSCFDGGLELLVRVVRRRAETEVAAAAVRDDARVEQPAAQLLGALRLEGEEAAEGLERRLAVARDVRRAPSSSKRSASSVVCWR